MNGYKVSLNKTLIVEMNEPTYLFKHGNVYTVVDGKVVASVKEADFADGGPMGGGMGGHPIHPSGPGADMPAPPSDLGAGGPPGGPCPDCGGPVDPSTGMCPQCAGAGGGMGMGGPPMPPAAGPMGAGPVVGSTITTPNGLKGEILGKTASMWGDEVTVRFENGRIVRLPVSDSLQVVAAAAPQKPLTVTLDERLAADVDGTKESLTNRLAELQGIERTARNSMGGSFETNSEMARIAAESRAEQTAVKQALAHLASEDAQAYRPPTPTYEFGKEVVAQETLGGGDASWLDHTVNDMIREAEMTDYEALMDEGPEGFVAGLDNDTVANQGVTHAVAARYIRSKTAGADESVRDRYEQVWLSRVEQVRRNELTNRKTETRKEAASQEADYSNLPDDVLFS